MAQQHHEATSAASSSPSPQDASTSTAAAGATAPTYSPLMRNLRQCGLFFAGAGFMAASIAVSRRSVMRRRLESVPRFYLSNRAPAQLDPADRSLLAAQAFGLATLNVASFAIMLVGGLSWAFDLCSVGELRERTQASLRRPGNLNPEDEKELEEMMTGLLERLGMSDKIEELEKTAKEAKGDEKEASAKK